jgi:hypothetical protein
MKRPMPTEGFIHFHHVFGRGVELVGGDTAGVVAVFFTTDDAGLNFEDDLVLHAFGEEFLGEAHVLGERQLGGVEHVALEEVVEACGAALGGLGDEGLEEAVHLLRLAVVGVESDEDVVLFRQAMRGLSEDDGTKGLVFERGAGGEFAAARGNLDDAVGLGLREGLQGTVDGGDGGDIDRRISVTAFLGGIEHGTVLGGSGDGHLVGVCLGVERPKGARFGPGARIASIRGWSYGL